MYQDLPGTCPGMPLLPYLITISLLESIRAEVPYLYVVALLGHVAEPGWVGRAPLQPADLHRGTLYSVHVRGVPQVPDVPNLHILVWRKYLKTLLFSV